MKTIHLPSSKEQRLLEQVSVRLVRPCEEARCARLLERHHYLGALRPVGERLAYVAVSPHGGWLAVLVFCAAAKHLRWRDQWIGWRWEQRYRRLGLVVNNARFLILPGKMTPNLGSRVLGLTLRRLSADWVKRYGHALCVVETFVDPERFQGIVYKAAGWLELGPTRGFRRCQRDYYVRHDRPKRLFVKELYQDARRSLQAEHLKPALAVVEQKAAPRCTKGAKELRALVGYFHDIPEYRGRIESYPLWSLLALVACAHWCGAPRGQKELAAFGQRLSQAQRRALGIRQNRRTGRYPAPSQPTFCRLLRAVDGQKLEQALLAFQAQIRGPASKAEVVAIDGKEPQHSRGQQLLTAVGVPSQYYLGSAPVSAKTNEIPVARELCQRLDLTGRLVGLDALHTQVETAQALVQEHGADYLLTVKDNQKKLKRTLAGLFAATPAAFSPSADGHDGCRNAGAEPWPPRAAELACVARNAGTGLFSGSGASRATDPPDERTPSAEGVSVDQPGKRAPAGPAVAE